MGRLHYFAVNNYSGYMDLSHLDNAVVNVPVSILDDRASSRFNIMLLIILGMCSLYGVVLPCLLR